MHSAFAPGKLILMGEHAVVYGHPALAMAVERGMTVSLKDRKGPTALVNAQINDPRLAQALLTVLPEEGVGVTINSTLPTGRGMGSSAALAVALGRASLAREGLEADPAEINRRAFKVERVFHGTPSGIDHTVSMLGGALRYWRTESGPQFEAVDLPPLPIVVIDSGIAGNTAEMVAQVAAKQPAAHRDLAEMANLLDGTLPALKKGDWVAVGHAWLENHRLLQAVGVSTPLLDRLVRLAVDAGATGAKLAGAGGGGVVIALAPEPEAVIGQAEAAGFNAFVTGCYPSR